ncbi:MAG: mevalonate kinase, partial [archaeon]
MQLGYGKLILFGEHFVVYGLPGIASAIGLYTRCRLYPNEKGITVNDRLTNKHILVGKGNSDILEQTMQIILKETALEKKNFRLEIDGNIPIFGGLGSSAALIVSIARELNREFLLNLSDKKINEIAFKAEHVFHSAPSGIDNTVSTFGGLVRFEKNLHGGKNKMEQLKMKKPLLVVIGNTRIIHDTGEAVKFVRAQKEKQPKKFEQIFGQAKELAHEAKKELIAGNGKKVGELLNKNQGLLKQVGVSS